MNKSIFFSLLWGFTFILITVLWIKDDNLPPSWDQAHYLYASEILHRTLTEKGFFSFLINTTTILGTKAPLISILPVPLYLIFGSGYNTALLVNIVFAIVFFVFFFKLVDMFYKRTTAMLAVIVISTMPLFYGLIRYYFVEFGLTALVVLWLYFLKKWDLFRKDKYVLFLGTVFAFGMLLKFHFPLFVIGPIITVLYANKKRAFKSFFKVKNFILFLFPILLIAAPWYIRNIQTVLWKARRATDPELLGDLYYGSAFSLNNFYKSSLDFINFVISPYWFIVITTGLVVYLAKRKDYKFNFFFVSWFIFPFIIFFLGPNKDYRLMLPLIPPIAILVSRFIDLHMNIVQKSIIVLPAVLIFINITIFNLSFFKKQLMLGQLIFSDEEVGEYVKLPQNSKWPITDILSEINKDSKSSAVIVLTAEDATLNINNLQYFSYLEKYPFTITSAAYLPKNTSLMRFTEIVNNSDYLILKEGGNVAPSDLNRFAIFTNNITESRKWNRLTSTISLPDGGKVAIWKKAK